MQSHPLLPYSSFIARYQKDWNIKNSCVGLRGMEEKYSNSQDVVPKYDLIPIGQLLGFSPGCESIALPFGL